MIDIGQERSNSKRTTDILFIDASREFGFYLGNFARASAPRLARHPHLHVRRLRALRTGDDLEFHGRSFQQRPISVAQNRRVVHKHIGTSVVAPNETESLRIVKPFDISLHVGFPFRAMKMKENRPPRTWNQRMKQGLCGLLD